jgi:hypothetical protein
VNEASGSGLCLAISLALYLLEIILEQLTKVSSVTVVAGTDKTHIVRRQRVRNNEMRLAAMLERPVGQIVRVRIRIILEATFFHNQSPGIDIWLSENKQRK